MGNRQWAIGNRLEARGKRRKSFTHSLLPKAYSLKSIAYRPSPAVDGFTLIELLLVISIVGLIMAVSLPVSYNMYLGHKASLKAEEVLINVSKIKREAFLYGEERVIYSKDGVMQRADRLGHVAPVVFSDIFVQCDAPVNFYKNGATSGGVLKIYSGEYKYLLHIQPLYGNLLLEKGS